MKKILIYLKMLFLVLMITVILGTQTSKADMQTMSGKIEKRGFGPWTIEICNCPNSVNKCSCQIVGE